ncbi:MAG: carboxypeptidase-like regulatory domain-containing protein [Ignavibacteriales bacterium]|nr:MAG: carboxypeptidase-like regulatory domain-containing protein [Ignavibacteriales bacterium]
MKSNSVKYLPITKLIISKLFFVFFLVSFGSCSSSSENNSFYWDCIPEDISPLHIKIFTIEYDPEKDSIKVEGYILDSLQNEALIGGNVSIYGEEEDSILSNTMTNAEGFFKLTAKYSTAHIIKFSHIGYKKKNYVLKDFIKQYFKLDNYQ